MNLRDTIQFATQCNCGSCKTCKALKAQSFKAPPDVDPKVPGRTPTPYGGRIHQGKVGKKTEGGQKKFFVKPRRTAQRLSKKKFGHVMPGAGNES